jgi:hypothetical protein
MKLPKEEEQGTMGNFLFKVLLNRKDKLQMNIGNKFVTIFVA